MHKAGCHPRASGIGHARGHSAKEGNSQRADIVICVQAVGKIMPRGMPDQHFQPVLIIHEPQTLKTANPNMAVRQAHQHCRACGRRLVMTLQRFTCFNH